MRVVVQKSIMIATDNDKNENSCTLLATEGKIYLEREWKSGSGGGEEIAK